MTEPRIERPSLADAFKGSGARRATSLGGLLPKNAAKPSAPAEPEVTAPQPATTPQRKQTHKPAEQNRATTRRAVVEHEGVQNVAVYLEPDVLVLVRAAKARPTRLGESEITYDEILVDALDQVSADQLRAEFGLTPTQSGGGPLQRRVRRPRGSGGIQIQVRLDGQQRRALDSLVAEVEAPSRSALVAAAYRLYLDKRERATQ